MQIHSLELRNFKCFAETTIDFNVGESGGFTLLVGENGTGKTSLLDALAVAAGIWIETPPDRSLQNSRRTILPNDIRFEWIPDGDRGTFRETGHIMVSATGKLDGEPVKWTREIPAWGVKVSNTRAKKAQRIAKAFFDRETRGETVVAPLIAYYGAGRAWLPSNRKGKEEKPRDGAKRRWGGYYDCLTERVRIPDLREWFLGELVELGQRKGPRPGFQAVERAVRSCIPGATVARYDGDRKDIVLSIDGAPCPYSALSSGRRMMLAMVADIAIKAVELNARLLPPDELGPEDEPLPRVLRDTPGLVLIDELDVHLHPKWQRRVIHDLKRTFPSMQFVCTTHSPQVIGEARPEEIRILEDFQAYQPPRSFGMESDRVLEEIMDAPSRDPAVDGRIKRAFRLIDERRFDEAETAIREFESERGAPDPEATRARTRIALMRRNGS